MIHGQKLKELSNKSKVINHILRSFKERQRTRHYIDIDRMYLNSTKDIIVDKKHFIQAWKDLEQLGVGRIIDNDRNGHSMFLLNYDMKKIGEAGLNGIDLDVDVIKQNNYTKDKKVITKTVEMKETIVVLPNQNGKSIIFKIPANLSPEVQRAMIDALTKSIIH